MDLLRHTGKNMDSLLAKLQVADGSLMPMMSSVPALRPGAPGAAALLRLSTGRSATGPGSLRVAASVAQAA